EAKCHRYHRSYLTDHEIGRYKSNAERLLTDFANAIVEKKRPDFLQQSLSDYKNAASRGHSSFRWWGVVEATGGALLWSLILIVVLLIIANQGIDVIEIYRRATGTH